MRHARYVLAFDSALEGCAAALFDVKTDTASQENRAMARGQSEQLVPMLQRVTAQAGVAFSDIELIAVTTGPGAFTGLRIGLSTARALALALDRPVIGMTTLDTLARQYLQTQWLEPGEQLAVILETKRSDFYYQLFVPEGYAPKPPAAGPAAELATAMNGRKIVCIGDALARFRATIPEQPGWKFTDGYARPDPVVLAKMAADLFGHAPKDKIFPPPEPLYLRPPDVSVPKKKLRTLDGAERLRDV